jgi:hypothetical protein
MRWPPGDLRIRQWAYFAIRTRNITGEQMSQRLDMAADTITVRGSRFPEFPERDLPRCHVWAVEAPPGADLGGSIEQLLARLQQRTSRIRSLVDELNGDATEVDALGFRSGATLQVVRYFGDRTGEFRGFGWHLDEPVISFLAETGAVLDVDEFDWR